MHLSICAKSSRTAGTILAALLLVVAGHGSLQAEAGGGAKSLALDSISVTANKIEEDITDVPQSVTVVDAFDIEEKQIQNIPDVIEEVPNMFVTDDHGTAVNFRGLNASMFTTNNPVVIYIDGVPYSDKSGFDASMANAERIEVLRGPQGTLYGKDAIGAVINVVTREPADRWQGTIGTEYGSHDRLWGTFNLSGPLLGDKLYAGINGQYLQDDGWIDNQHDGDEEDSNDKDERRISGYLLFKPTARLSARLTLSHDYTRENWIDGYGLPGDTNLNRFDRNDALSVEFDSPTFTKTRVDSQSLHIAYDFDAVEFTSVTTHRKLDQDSEFDADLSDSAAYDGLMQFDMHQLDTWAQELRLARNTEAGLRWVGGLYFDFEDREQEPYGMQFPNYDAGGTFLGNFEMNAESRTDSNTQAIFGQVMAPLFERFELTLGGRYQRIEKAIDLDMYYLPVGVEGPSMFQLDDRKKWYVFLPKAALSYRVTDSWTAYFSWSKGYMPGGFNYFAMMGTSDDNSFEPQKSTNYELGIKGSFDRLRLAASIFRMDIRDIHIYKVAGPGIFLTDNAKKAHSQGAELEVTYLPVDSVELSAALGIIDAEYDDYDAGTVKYDGEKIENTPSHTAHIGVAYHHPGGFYARTDISHYGTVHFFNGAIESFEKQSDYTVVDLKFGYLAENWEVYGYAHNLTDEDYVTSFKSSSVVAMTTFGEPRTFGVGARYRF